MDAKTRITPNIAKDKTLERYYYASEETKDHGYSNNRISPTP